MKKILFLLFCISFLTACDDGDIIVTTFNFDNETQLNACRENQGFDSEGNTLEETDKNIYILYTTNNEPNESISLSINQDFTGKFEGLTTADTLDIQLNATNKIVYRTYTGSINGNQYFCGDLPPSNPKVIEEYVSAIGGNVELITTIINQDDNDGVEKELEDLNNNGNYFDDDTDNDGIPNFLDTDDDNDNVPTQVEIEIDAPILTENDFPDSDGDGIPNYLDEDDDNDGTISRYEDLNAYVNADSDGNPILNPQDDDTNDNDIPNYLDPEDFEALEINIFRDNIINRTFRTRVIARNITMQSTYSDEVIVLETLVLGYLDVTSNNEIIVPD